MAKIWLGVLISFLLCGCITNNKDKTIILENGYFFDGNSFIPFKELIILNDKIVSISNFRSNSAGIRISTAGKYLIPGLVDFHVHLISNPFYIDTSNFILNANITLKCGVTTVVDLFFPEIDVLKTKSRIVSAPELYTSAIFSGPILTAPGGHGTEYGIPARLIDSLTEIDTVVKDVIKNGADVIKVVYEGHSSANTISFKMLKKIVQIAHQYDKKVFVHILTTAEAVDCADAGADVIAHMPIDSFTEEQLAKIVASKIVIIPTLTVFESYFSHHSVEYLSDTLLLNTSPSTYISRIRIDTPSTPIFGDSIVSQHPIKIFENFKNILKTSIPILAGTDAGNPLVFHGYALHNELSEYVNAGMSNVNALRTATQNADLFFPEKKIGKLKAGYFADIIVLNKNPLKSIANTKSIQLIIHRGRIVQR